MPDEKPLSEAWEEAAADWVQWARKPAHDSYWRFHKAPFFELLPPPGRLTVDVGCGEGRVARDLKALGHNVIAVDVSPTMVQAAREADPEMQVILADAARMPLDAGVADLVVSFMSLHDADDMAGAVSEIGRILSPGGVLCMAVVHPINSAGKFESVDADSPFVIEESYYASRRYQDRLERNGLRMTFTSRHWPLQAYALALERAGFVIEVLRELTVDADSVAERAERERWTRLPLFLDLRARKR
jgi:SAM-dependent methyltransferase